MNKLITMSMCLSAANAFGPSATKTTSTFFQESTSSTLPYFLDEASPSQASSPFAYQPEVATTPDVTEAAVVATAATAEALSPPEPMRKRRAYTVVKTVGAGGKKNKKPKHPEGIFSPIVTASKKIVGEAEINQLRGKVISMHSGVIGDFVSTHETDLGTRVAKQLFALMDKDGNGTLDAQELQAGFEKLGFSWLGEKQVAGILKRADKDNNGVIDYEEFEAELSKTLRVNLIKLAKKNGEELGFLV